MDSGNGPNQQQRYCPTPIMAPPSVATSPPLMSGNSVMNPLHQPTHHPPPSISPHPGAYYGHHTSGTSHYPTPSPTPPPPSMHHQHQQYYAHAHPYYAHGSHQQAQQQQSQQSQHHGISNTHVPINTPPGTTQQANQHSHMMSHSSYHHPQTPAHHQQWATHPHQQQQSHHYYHQPTHHSPSHQSPQQVQQHGYPPPPHSPYSYVQSHTPAPTPPPPSHTPHSQQQQLHPPNAQPQSQQQQHPPPQVSVSPGPGQIHQAAPQQQQQQPQSHALMNLSRFVSQQSPTSPSPRASPNVASHHPQQQMPPMGPSSPLPYNSHMNGHTAPVTNTPVMSPPPAPLPPQPPMSPIPVSQPQHQMTLPPQSPYSINGGEVLDIHSSAKPVTTVAVPVSSNERDSSSKGFGVKADTSSNPANKARELPNVFSNITPSKIASFMNCDLKKSLSLPTNVTKSNTYNNTISQNNTPSVSDTENSVGESGYASIPNPNASPIPGDERRTPDIPKEFGDSASSSSGNKHASCSPSLKPTGSPPSSGNGHQMMPVRLQNMHKGARTKANMKKLMQEQQITTPNGQVTDLQPDSNLNAKDTNAIDPILHNPSPEKPTKSPRKRKTQNKDSAGLVTPNDSSVMPMSPINMDLITGTGDSSVPATPVVRPGYTKLGKKIGRPKKNVSPALPDASTKPKKKREKKVLPKKAKGVPPVLAQSQQPVGVETAPTESVFDSHVALDLLSVEVPQPNSKVKRKPGKKSRKRGSSDKFASDISEFQEAPPVEVVPEVVAHVQVEEQLNSIDTSVSKPAPVKTGGRRKSKNKKQAVKTKASASEESSPDLSAFQQIPGSEISEQVAGSVADAVAQQVNQPVTPITSKGKRKGRKLKPLVVKAATSGKRGKRGGRVKKEAIPVAHNETIVVTPDRGDLPRLRSRSPKQRESPPLRMSSPRAAKERSTTPATSTGRSRTSRDKESGSTVTTPLSSPLLRSPKKSPEKERSVSRSSSRQQMAESVSVDAGDVSTDLMSPPPSKRLRQLSKESLDSSANEITEKKGKSRRKQSRESEKSTVSPTKRVSRRKSGSVTSSSDNLSSPSFNEISPSVSQTTTYALTETPSDFSESDRSNVNMLPITIDHHRRRKKGGRGKRKLKRASIENVPEPATMTIDAPDQSVIESKNQTDVFQVQEVQESLTLPAPVAIKRRKSRSPGKRGKRRRSSTAAAAPVDLPIATMETSEEVNESQVENSEAAAAQDETRTKPLIVKLKGLKGRKGAGRSKKQKVLPDTTSVLNIPIPAIQSPAVVAKKNVKFKAESIGRKPSKKAALKALAAANDYEFSEDADVSAQSETLASTRDSFAAGTQPLNITHSKRRRSSLASATNTQVSAKLNTQHSETEVSQKLKAASPITASAATNASPSSNPKTLRRDSRSRSRDYDVSVVLTDIVQTFTAGDSSLLGISTSLSRLQSPTNASFTSASSSVQQLKTEPILPVSDLKEEISPSVPTTAQKITKRGRRKSKQKSEPINNSKKKIFKLVHPNQELQDRKAKLEAEVALVLLDLKTSTSSSSKSPSPAKSTVDSQVVISKKKAKSRKRKHSRSPRRSIDTSAMSQDTSAVPETTFSESAMSTFDYNTTANTPTFPPPPPPVTKVTKRKGMKGRRWSNAKKLNEVAALPTENDLAQVNQPSTSSSLLSLSANTFTATKLEKVEKMEANDTSEFEMLDSPVGKAKLTMGKKKSPTKTKGRKVDLSPDISQLPVGPMAAAPKQRRKRAKKESKSDPQSGLEFSLKTETTSQADPNETIDSASGTEILVKKKRQRKQKNAVVETPVTTSEPVPSTSRAALASQLPSTSKLFPYQTSPKPYKKPTVFAKSSTITDAGKEDDNQKKKGQDGPILKVIDGRTRFYRGGESEELDLYPKLPKDKAQLPTDNAVPWICSFCHLGPHALKLGDLFGPYFANLPSIYGKPSTKRETWMHGDCALWAGRLILVGTYVKQLEETLRDADQEICTICGKNGATIGCLRRGCKEAVHYPCAVRRFWKMDEQIFHSYCPKHS